MEEYNYGEVYAIVDWHNGTYGVALLLEPIRIMDSVVREVFIHNKQYHGHKYDISTHTPVTLSGITNSRGKFAANKWSVTLSNEDFWEYLETALKLHVKNYLIYGFLEKYVKLNSDAIFKDIFSSSFTAEDATLYRGLSKFRKELSEKKSEPNQFLAYLDLMLIRNSHLYDNTEEEQNRAYSGELSLIILPQEDIVQYLTSKSSVKNRLKDLYVLKDDAFNEIIETLIECIALENHFELIFELYKDCYRNKLSTENLASLSEKYRSYLVDYLKKVIVDEKTYFSLTLSDVTLSGLREIVKKNLDTQALSDFDNSVLAALHQLDYSPSRILQTIARNGIVVDWTKNIDLLNECSPDTIYSFTNSSLYDEEFYLSLFYGLRDCSNNNKHKEILNLVNALSPENQTKIFEYLIKDFKENFDFEAFEMLIETITEKNYWDNKIIEIAKTSYLQELKAKTHSALNHISASTNYYSFHFLYEIPKKLNAYIEKPINEYIVNEAYKNLDLLGISRLIHHNIIEAPDSWSEIKNITKITCDSTREICEYLDATQVSSLVEYFTSNLEDKLDVAFCLAHYCDEIDEDKIRKKVFDKLSVDEKITLWEQGFISDLSVDEFSNYIVQNYHLENNEIQNSVQSNLTINRIINKYIKANQPTDELFSSIFSFINTIDTREKFQLIFTLYKCFNERHIQLQTTSFPLGNLMDWYTEEHISDSIKIDENLIRNIRFFTPKQQPRYIKKLFTLSSIDLRKVISILNDVFEAKCDSYDFSSVLVVNALNSFLLRGKFITGAEIMKLFYAHYSEELNINSLCANYFEWCAGRTKFKKINPSGTVKEVNNCFVISFNEDLPWDEKKPMIDEIKLIPGGKYDTIRKVWYIPLIQIEFVKILARNNFLILELKNGDEFLDNEHLRLYYRSDSREFKLCCGRYYKDTVQGTPIYWCNNEACYGITCTIHKIENWQDYSMLDFCHIMGLDTTEIKYDKEIPFGKYFTFIEQLNWFRRASEHLYCRECGKLLYPRKTAEYAKYQVVRFECINENCREKNNEIYLNTCLNGYCKEIIDSRDSKKCPNGWYICHKCGSCCSNDVFERRYSNLQRTGGFVDPHLEHLVFHKLGHAEQGKMFCYKCGSECIRTNDGKVFCEKCNRYLYESIRNKKQ